MVVGFALKRLRDPKEVAIFGSAKAVHQHGIQRHEHECEHQSSVPNAMSTTIQECLEDLQTTTRISYVLGTWRHSGALIYDGRESVRIGVDSAIGQNE